MHSKLCFIYKYVINSVQILTLNAYYKKSDLRFLRLFIVVNKLYEQSWLPQAPQYLGLVLKANYRFIKRYTKELNLPTIKIFYTSLIRSNLKYASILWNPVFITDSQECKIDFVTTWLIKKWIQLETLKIYL